MVNKELAEWIKSEEAQGYTEEQLREYLTQQGYKKKDIEDAISSLVSAPVIFDAKKVFKPSLLKLFIPVLLLIIIFASHYVNSSHLPAVGESFCESFDKAKESAQITDEYNQLSQSNDPDPEEVIRLLEERDKSRESSLESGLEIREHFNSLILGNMYFIPTKIYKLNPLFPIPCEASSALYDQGFSNLRCSYYINQETYDCIYSYYEKQQQETEGAGFASIFKPLPYSKAGFFDLMLNAILLAVIIYVLVCLISFALDFLNSKPVNIKLIAAGILLVLPFILFILGFVYPLFLYPLTILFSILVFIKNKRAQTILLYIFSALLIISLIAGIFIGGFIIDSTTTRQMNVLPQTMEFQYESVPCNNSGLLEDYEKERRGIIEEYLDEEWNVCMDPSCSEICDESFEQYAPGGDTYIVELRGDNASCVCGYRER